jgi:hypothetical protein
MVQTTSACDNDEEDDIPMDLGSDTEVLAPPVIAKGSSSTVTARLKSKYKKGRQRKRSLQNLSEG